MLASARKISAALLAVALVAAGFASGSTIQASAGTVTQLDATQIVADMGAGWNLGNQLEANSGGVPSETVWGQPVITQALIDKVKAAGFKTIRIPVSYLRKIGSAPNYPIDAAWLNRIQQVVDYAYNRGLYVLINMHGDGYKTIGGSWLICDAANQTAIRDKYQKVWQQIATRFANYDQRLILESMNENFDGQWGRPTQPCYSNINSYNQIFVDTVRRAGGNNSSRWLLVPGWNTNIDYTAGNYGFVIPTDQYRSPSIPSTEKRLMISVHYYDPWDFAGAENGTITQWGRASTNPAKRSTWGQEDHLDAQLKKMHDKFVTQGYPVVVGEYGAIDKSSFDSGNPRYRADYMRAVVSTAKKYGAATIYWDNGGTGRYGFGLINRRTLAVAHQGVVDAIMSGLRTGNVRSGQSGVLVDEAFSSQTSPANFGFPSGAAVTGGVLNVTNGMGNYTTSVKAFDAPVVRERTLDLSFDWKTAVSNSGAKTGLELRDDQGNLVFSLAGTATELRYGLTGPVSNSTSAPDSLNPAWTKLSYDRAKWYTVTLHLDFTLQRVQYLISTKETGARVMASGTASITGTNLAKLVACNYYGTGVQSIDNFRLTAPANAANGSLKGKTMYAFGDSIVAGHTYSRGFAHLTAERELMTLTKYAVNGATVNAGGNQILTQVRNASAQSPDFVVFDGGTNDAYPDTFNKSTFTSAFDTTVRTMRTKWPNARIVYVAVHKLGSRDWNTQLAIRDVTTQVCAKYGVTVADVFNDTALDTRTDSHRVAYTFNGLVNGYPGTGGTGTHPNLAGITNFYVPVLTASLS